MTDDNTALGAARITPTVSQPTRVDWGSWVEQFLAHETPLIEAAANAGVQLATAAIPGGAIIRMFVTEKLVDQYVELGIKALDGILDRQSLTIGDSSPLLVYITNMFNTTVPLLAGKLGPELDGAIRNGLVKAGLKI
jgi:hypothetical protein